MQKSPCATCQNSHRSKVKQPCRTCKLPSDYADSLERGVECRDDPAYQMAYSTPPMFRSQLRTNPMSTWDLIAFF